MIVEALQQILNLVLSVIISLPMENFLDVVYNVMNLLLQILAAVF